MNSGELTVKVICACGLLRDPVKHGGFRLTHARQKPASNSKSCHVFKWLKGSRCYFQCTELAV